MESNKTGKTGSVQTIASTIQSFVGSDKTHRALAPERFFEIASQSSGQCWSLTTYCPWPGPAPTAPSNRGYEGGFLTALMLKDLKLAQEAAAKSGAATPLGAQAEATYALFDRLGYGRKDFSAVLQLLRGQLDELG